ncbi:AfsR/SARP family transcriptional regulator [Arthrobacter sp. VKM Ac-2550]|uniref:AfsR/SARP family transcriptional regulator n=1 Tax=Crystallibacter permensis TaxID=1938888 RepID=UPI002227FD23|nr:bacterial transcriptional activator domain-containing protein [Arthrobacter sp. VKM Ac-2550]MCW2135005.1 DNA-binding transcriptional activator of the SARP family [Arthrobacter sp. VKM Ac-2550]
MGIDQSWELQVIGGWQLSHNRKEIRVVLRQQRLLALLALRGSLSRNVVAGMLWPQTTERQASGSLRATVCALRREWPDLLEIGDGKLALSRQVRLDLEHFREQISHEIHPPGRSLMAMLRRAELLPGWYEDWVIDEQERWTLLRLAALERAAVHLLANGDNDDAIDAARTMIDLDPAHEIAYQLLLRAQLADGNRAEAMRTYRDFRSMLHLEFGTEPSEKTALFLRQSLQV